jgi:NADP-dependent 3-hydroxy acid dehydrogenase YdfG
MTKIKDSVVLITGADGGIGTSLLNECLLKKAKKIYVTGLRQEGLSKLQEKDPNIIVPLVLDVTNAQNIKECADSCSDVNILINNAGVELKIPFTAENASKAAAFEMNINYIGVIEMINQFTSILAKNNDSAIVNIMSLASCSNN